MCTAAPVRVEKTGTAGTGWTAVAVVELDLGHRLVGVEVQVSGPSEIRLLSPLGFVAWSTTTSGAGIVGTVIDGAFESYRLQVKATSSPVAVVAALSAR